MRALRAQTDVMVDLSELVYADVSLMLDFMMLARRIRSQGAIVLLRGARPQVQALIELVGLHAVAGVRVEGLSTVVA